MSALNTSDGMEHGKSTYPSLGLGNSFAFKFEDRKGRIHRLNYGEHRFKKCPLRCLLLVKGRMLGIVTMCCVNSFKSFFCAWGAKIL